MDLIHALVVVARRAAQPVEDFAFEQFTRGQPGHWGYPGLSPHQRCFTNFRSGASNTAKPLGKRDAAAAWRLRLRKVATRSEEQVAHERLMRLEKKVLASKDGHQWHEATPHHAQNDKSRDRKLTAAGWQVLRITGSEVYRDAAACVREVRELIARRRTASVAGLRPRRAANMTGDSTTLMMPPDVEVAVKALMESSRLLVADLAASQTATTAEERRLRLQLARLYFARVRTSLDEVASKLEAMEGLPDWARPKMREMLDQQASSFAKVEIQLAEAEKAFAASSGTIGKA